MKTDDLVAMLATGVDAVDPRTVEKRFALALGLGLSGAGILMVALLGVRPDLAQVAKTGTFWLKLAFPAAVLGATLSVTMRLARPGGRAGAGWLVSAGVLAALWLGAGAALVAAPPALRPHMILGDTWRVCTACVTLLSLPAFCAVFWALRGLAPTNPRQAGAAAGLLAGAQGLLVYCLHCPETALPFWGIWYSLGLLVPAALGAGLGKVLLRW
jgi:hypothetical protein